MSVVNNHGTSAAGNILPPYEGTVSIDNLGAVVTPPGCQCEVEPAPSEFDYLPPPRVSSVSTSAGPTSLASEKGTTLVTLHGTGLDPLGINWVDIGPSSAWSSQVTSYDFVSGNLIQLVAPVEPLTVVPGAHPLDVEHFRGLISLCRSHLRRRARCQWSRQHRRSDNSRRNIRCSGHGTNPHPDLRYRLRRTTSRADRVQRHEGLLLRYAVLLHGRGSRQREYRDRPTASWPGRRAVVHGHGLQPRSALQTFSISSRRATRVSRRFARARGLRPEGQTWWLAVTTWIALWTYSSATREVKAHSPVKGGAAGRLTCTSTTTVAATSPPGPAGTSVPVSVTTIESYFSGAGSGTTTANFSYR